MWITGLIVFMSLLQISNQYKPIIFMHGIIGNPAEADFIISTVKKVHLIIDFVGVHFDIVAISHFVGSTNYNI